MSDGGERCERGLDEGAKSSEPGEEQSDVVSGSDQDGVGGVAASALQPVALEFSIGLHVADDRFDGASAAQFPLEGGRGQAAGPGDIDARLCEAVAAVALIDIGALDRDAGEAFDLDDLRLEGMAVVGQAGTGLSPDDKLAALGLGVDHCEGRLDAKLIAGSGLALGDALHFGGMQSVELVAIFGLLSEQPQDRLADALEGLFQSRPT